LIQGATAMSVFLSIALAIDGRPSITQTTRT
jgi:hypothetical protein